MANKAGLTARELETAIKDGMNTIAVRGDGSSMILRPPNSSRVFQMCVQIEAVIEL